jgi:hypothetical protein
VGRETEILKNPDSKK